MMLLLAMLPVVDRAPLNLFDGLTRMVTNE